MFWEILIVEDQPNMRTTLVECFKREGYIVHDTGSGAEAVEKIKSHPFDIILSDIKLDYSDEISGLDILRIAKEIRPQTEVILMTAFGSLTDGIKAMKLGAYDYITKPFRLDEILLIVQKACEKRALTKEVYRLQKELNYLSGFENIIGRSEKMLELMRIVSQISPTDTTVLISGESGTGKELIARALHNLSLRKTKPFVVVNCAAIPDNLQESEIFGYVKGAFTGAFKDKPGLFEEANYGTLFLDEIGEASLSTQMKLLRFLEDGEIRRLGDTKSFHVDVRLITATNRDLKKLIELKKFRKDLYYRLNTITLHLPPLRERKGDIPLLINHFIKKFQEKFGKNVVRVSREAMDLLIEYNWPGNVRELANTIERGIALCSGDTLRVQDLPRDIVEYAITRNGAEIQEKENEGDLDEILPLEEVEKIIILKGLKLTNGNRSELARRLKISKVTLWRKMKNYGIF